MAKTATQKIQELQEELEEANGRIEELEDHIRSGTELLDIEDLEEALDEAEDADGEDEDEDEDDDEEPVTNGRRRR